MAKGVPYGGWSSQLGMPPLSGGSRFAATVLIFLPAEDLSVHPQGFASLDMDSKSLRFGTASTANRLVGEADARER